MATSIISNTVTDLNGTAVEGATIVVRLIPGPAFRVTEGTEIASQDSTTTDSAGLWSIALERNTNIDPTGSYYEVEEQIPDAQGGPKVWTIQVGASNQTLQAALVDDLPDVSGPTYLTQAAADARYQALGSLGSTTPQVRATANATAGVSTSARRDDAVASLHAEVAGAGLAISGGILEVDADDVGTEIVADKVALKDDGTTLARLSTQARALVLLSQVRQGVR